MIQTGLVSVTFRKLQPDEIIGLVRQAGLQGIEWGGDVHVPHGDITKAKEVAAMTESAGLKVAAYGSYYRVGCVTDNPPFEKVLQTAVALHAPTIRVWAGDKASNEANMSWRRQVEEDARQIAALAAAAGFNLAFEYHQDTLTDTSESARRLLMDIDRSNVRSYWQPPMELSQEARMLGLQEILPWLSNLHVYNQCGSEPEPFKEGLAEWKKYLDIIRNVPGERYCLLEFVQGDSPEQFLEDAEALRSICDFS